VIGALLYGDMPDTDNDEVPGSFKARDSPNTKNPIGGERRGAFKLIDIFYFIDITIIVAYSTFPLTGGMQDVPY
jgi:hypothetical protein